MKRKLVEIIKVTNELMFEMCIKNKIKNHNVYDVKKLISTINNGHPWALMVNSTEIQTLLECCEIDKDPFHTMINNIKQLNMNQNQFEFKPFDKVLVRDCDAQHWKINFFSHTVMKDGTMFYTCIASRWVQCIPYNEETKHLLGTANDYQKQEPKEYHVWTSGTFDQWFTKTEFENFIKTAVINNKDISDFHVLYVKCNN